MSQPFQVSKPENSGKVKGKHSRRVFELRPAIMDPGFKVEVSNFSRPPVRRRFTWWFARFGYRFGYKTCLAGVDISHVST